MNRSIVAAISLVMFILLAGVVSVVTDIHDRSFPVNLGVHSTVNLDFSDSMIAQDQAFDALARRDQQADLGLFKVLPQSAGEQTGEVFVALGGPAVDAGATDPTVDRYGANPDSRVVTDRQVLQGSFASGRYVLNGDTDGVAGFRDWLASQRVTVDWVDDDAVSTLRILLQGGFLSSLVAGAALMVSMVLFWLAAKARSRALRVLAGTPARRIQVEDLGSFVVTLVVAGMVATAAGSAYVWWGQGGTFVVYYALTMAGTVAVTTGAALVGGVVVAWRAWPRPDLIAHRKPAVGSLRGSATTLRLVTFGLVAVAIVPAVADWRESASAAANLAKWKSLSEQVVVTFPSAMGPDGFQQALPKVGSAVGEAEDDNAVSLSYAWTPDVLDEVDFGRFDAVALVNNSWLDIMLRPEAGDNRDTSGQLISVSDGDLSPSLTDYMASSFPLWTRNSPPRDQPDPSWKDHAGIELLEYAGQDLAVASAGGGGLAFFDRVLLLVATDVSTTFNDDFLASIASTGNLVFAGMQTTRTVLADQGLAGTLNVKSVAEEGILRAQFAAYFAWLRAMAIAALAVALVVATVVGAFISAVLNARRDFPLRLYGRTWWQLLQRRIVGEAAAILAVAGVILAVRRADGWALICAATLTSITLVAIINVAVARWNFDNVALRRT